MATLFYRSCKCAGGVLNLFGKLSEGAAKPHFFYIILKKQFGYE
ncbi:MAG: hypothetical protein ACK5NT_12450 [Pyrinomonadaceae bacterium]